MSIYSGNVIVKDISYNFDYNEKILRVRFSNVDELKDYSSNVLIGKLFPYDNKIIFYRENKYYDLFYIRSFDCDLVFKYKNSIHNDEKIKRLKFELNELDHFFDFDTSPYNNMILENIKRASEIEFHSDYNINNEKIRILIDNKEMKYSIEVDGTYSKGQLQPFSYKKYLSIYYDFDDDYNLIYKTINIVRNLFAFLNYRKNIKFNSILFSMIDENNMYYDIGNIDFNSLFYNELVTDEYIKLSCIKYSYIHKYLPIIFQNIIDEKIGIRNIPDNQITKGVYTPERIIMIASSFEMIYKSLNISVEHSRRSIDSKDKIATSLDNLIDSEKFKSSEKGILKRFKDRLYDESFSSKINEVLKRYKFIEKEVIDIYNRYSRNYLKSNFSTTLETLRNNMAHYNLEENIKENRVVALIGLEVITYSLQLIKCGVDEKTVIRIASTFIY